MDCLHTSPEMWFSVFEAEVHKNTDKILAKPCIVKSRPMLNNVDSVGYMGFYL